MSAPLPFQSKLDFLLYLCGFPYCSFGLSDIPGQALQFLYFGQYHELFLKFSFVFNGFHPKQPKPSIAFLAVFYLYFISESYG